MKPDNEVDHANIPAPPEALDRDKMELVEAMRVMRQALHEIDHAQRVGPDWYTRKSSGMYQQVNAWIKRGFAAAKVLDKYE